jgi:hypothetical protein
VLHGIAGDRAPISLIDETVHLVETGLLGMSMRRPFISDETCLGRLRNGYVESVTDFEDAPTQFNICKSNASFVDKLESVSA